jgi:hypothetical protein
MVDGTHNSFVAAIGVGCEFHAVGARAVVWGAKGAPAHVKEAAGGFELNRAVIQLLGRRWHF